jgi:hypothetical protein
MKLRWSLATAVSAVLLCGAGAQERRMDVKQMPDSVFAQPVETLIAELHGATPTGENGRIGGELVFWGYRLGDGKPVFLFACAMLENVNCGERTQMICPDHTTVLQTGTTDGNIVRRECRNIAVAAPGERRPGCIDTPQHVPVAIGLVSCGGA